MNKKININNINPEKNEEKVKNKKEKKKKSTFLLVVLFAMLTSFIILYFTSGGIRDYSNNLFKNIPFLGKVFVAMPTADEKQTRKEQLADYYLALDIDRAKDKLIIMKKEDENLYNDILMEMNKIDIDSTKIIIDEIRNNEIKKDSLQREFENMNKDKSSDLQNIAKEYIKLGLVGTVGNLQNDIIDLKIDFDVAAKLFENFKPDYAAKVLYYLDSNIASSIKEKMTKTLLNKIRAQLANYENYVRKEQSLANIYSNKGIDESVKELSSKDKYSAVDLGIIFTNMDYLLTARILSKFTDKEYVNEILNEIKNIEDLSKMNNQIEGYFSNVNKALKIMDLYNDDVFTLQKSYEKMTPVQISDLVKQMTSTKPKFKQYVIDATKTFNITEEELMLDILKKMKPKVLSQVITTLDPVKGAELSRKLGLPVVQ